MKILLKKIFKIPCGGTCGEEKEFHLVMRRTGKISEVLGEWNCDCIGFSCRKECWHITKVKQKNEQ